MLRPRPWQWREFKEVAARRLPNRLYATLNRKAEFVINLKTYRAMNEPEAIVPLYDPRTRIIGLKPSRVEVPNAVLVQTRHARYRTVIRSKRFLDVNGIEVKDTLQFPTPAIDRERILVLNLREAVAVAHMPRKRPQR